MMISIVHSILTNNFLSSVVSVVSKTGLLVRCPNGENPLTKIWLPHALQEPTLFLATLSFAAVHIEALTGSSGSQTSLETLRQKGEAIKCVDSKLHDSSEALSNETIGAVSMLAAAEV